MKGPWKVTSNAMMRVYRDVGDATRKTREVWESTRGGARRDFGTGAVREAAEMVSNADRIRGMSDEGLAGWLVDATVCERVCHEDEYCHGNECVKRVTGWLRQPAETEGVFGDG